MAFYIAALSFRMKRLLVFLLISSVLAFGCASNKKHKRLKPGKPIPCPLKDC